MRRRLARAAGAWAIAAAAGALLSLVSFTWAIALAVIPVAGLGYVRAGHRDSAGRHLALAASVLTAYLLLQHLT